MMRLGRFATPRSAARGALLVWVIALAGCASEGSEAPADGGLVPTGLSAAGPSEIPAAAPFGAESEKVNETIVNQVLEAVDSAATPALTGDSGEPTPVGDEITHNTTQAIPLELNADVQRWIDYFTTRDADRFRRFLERGEKFKPIVAAVLRDQGIPTEIFYQALIESGFSTSATSSARAVGIWQFIPQTGRRYGLRIDQYVDERRDPMRSTIAAALYLKDLYNVFQSWYLALAAYNAGEGRIMSAIMRAKTRDFWEMVRIRALPAETMNYIPKFLAATTIGHNPKRYGFDDLSLEMAPTLTSVAIPSPIRLADVADVTGIPLSILKEFNPQVLRGVTPPDVSTYRVWVPKDQANAVEAQSERLASMKLRSAAKRAVASVGSSPTVGERFHVVKRGETLAKVAAAYGLSLTKLKTLNSMRSNRVTVGTKLMIASSAEPTAIALHRYRVKHGDNLNTIAKRFGMSIDDLKRVNRLKKNRVYAGQVLHVASDRG